MSPGGQFLMSLDKRRAFPSEFDRLIAATEVWCREVYAEAGPQPEDNMSDDLYPEAIWYAWQIRSRIAEMRDLREREPDLVLGLALVLGELIGEARAHLLHGENAARGLKSLMRAREGHEQVHGTKEKRRAGGGAGQCLREVSRAGPWHHRRGIACGPRMRCITQNVPCGAQADTGQVRETRAGPCTCGSRRL
jgi:hypothetical protein